MTPTPGRGVITTILTTTARSTILTAIQYNPLYQQQYNPSVTNNNNTNQRRHQRAISSSFTASRYCGCTSQPQYKEHTKGILASQACTHSAFTHWGSVILRFAVTSGIHWSTLAFGLPGPPAMFNFHTQTGDWLLLQPLNPDLSSSHHNRGLGLPGPSLCTHTAQPATDSLPLLTVHMGYLHVLDHIGCWPPLGPPGMHPPIAQQDMSY